MGGKSRLDRLPLEIYRYEILPITDCCIKLSVDTDTDTDINAYVPFMLDDVFLVIYDVHSYSTRDAFIQENCIKWLPILI